MDQGAAPNIPGKINCKYHHCFSPSFYRERNWVERLFNKIKHLRQIATRYEKPAANYLAMIKLAATRISIRAYESMA
ncbi:MAG TPA: hypothetical protein DDW95_00030 [Alphaproteobacteria bacterium]|nr:hypothetical protein [Alphaproteobacteria bacterium]HBF96910.1 hypothetical protein [Alphaproteobacteria bacterium]